MRYLNIASPVEDNELIQGCLRQDRKYQEAVFRRYAGKLLVVSLRYARHRMEAEDILQDAFIRIFDHIDQFQGKGSLGVLMPAALYELHGKLVLLSPGTASTCPPLCAWWSP